MVKSEKLYTPQTYLELVTGEYFIINGDNDIDTIENILKDFKLDDDLWNYPLSEIDHIVENDLDVVLVECMVYNNNTREYEHVYRWFEVAEEIEIND